MTVISLAKRLEEVYIPGRSEPIDLPADAEASKLLQRVRDEAHRFAIEHHRGRRGRAMIGSVLDELKGVGPARKRALLSISARRSGWWRPAARSSRRCLESPEKSRATSTSS